MKKTKQVENNNSKKYLTPEEYLGESLGDVPEDDIISYDLGLEGTDYDVHIEQWPCDQIHIIVKKGDKGFIWAIQNCDVRKSTLAELDTSTNLMDMYDLDYSGTVKLGVEGGQA